MKYNFLHIKINNFIFKFFYILIKNKILSKMSEKTKELLASLLQLQLGDKLVILEHNEVTYEEFNSMH